MRCARVWLWLTGLAFAIGLGVWMNRQVEALLHAKDVEGFGSWVDA